MSGRLTSELFVEPCDEGFLVYSPLKRVAFVGDQETATLVSALQSGRDIAMLPDAANLLAFLRDIGVLDGETDTPPSDHTDAFCPTEAVIMPTADCSLRCIYCFSNGGMSRQHLLYETTQAAVDFIMANAVATRTDPIVIFHGGGEPTLNWNVLVRTAEYARQRASEADLKLRISLVTNGILSTAHLKWIESHVDRLTVSFDGPRDVQDLQRPFKDGRGSFARVYRTCARLSEHGYSFGIRSTITTHNVSRMAEMVQLFAAFNVRAIQLEPLTECGRCGETGCEEPDPRVYVDEFKKAMREASKHNIVLYCSGTRFLRLGTRFCGAAGSTFCVTPDGHVSTCHRVSSPDDPLASTFFYGRYDQTVRRFVIDEPKVRRLRTLHVDVAPACGTCFAKWHCAGGCYQYNWLATGSMLLRERTGRCHFTRELTKYKLAQLVREKSERGGEDSGDADHVC